MSGPAEKSDCWRWEESRYTNPGISDWRGRTVTAGVDIGSTSTQAVIMIGGELYAYASMRTGANSPDSARSAMSWAMEGTGMAESDPAFTVGTGYGRVNVPFANKTITEISCHARGANFIYGPTVRTILDMGGQDCKAIHCDEKGAVTSFMMNDKCAAGTGRGMEVIANLLSVHVEDIGDLSFKIDEEPPMVSSICVIFAKTEATNLIRQGWTKEKVLAAYCHAMAYRVVKLLERNEVQEDFAITGGIAKNKGVVKRIEKLLGIEALATEHDTQLAGAIGAALIARDLLTRAKKKEEAQ
ncbi:MAG: benzoyl-CoA reductase, bzd-type, subunit Q [Clostridiales Family XIII bacterium]|jgi:bzd-type benzoyl-CoA reductase Q subunit|nr:benzoyl-CoA reductase, bzd-type, subunit Q [Clostridiales Family XIII bacterium]